MNNEGWTPRGDLDAAREFMASVSGSGSNRGGSRGGRGGGRGGGRVGAFGGVRAGAVGSYKPYEHGVSSGNKLVKELPSNFYAPTNVLNVGQFANGQNRTNTQNDDNAQRGGYSQSGADSMDIDAGASVPTPTGWGTTGQPAATTLATWPTAAAPAAAPAASTPTSWEMTNTGDHFGQVPSSTDPWGATTARAQPPQSAPTHVSPACTFWNGAQASSANAAPPTRAAPSSRGNSRAVPIVDPRGRASSPVRGMGVSVHASTPTASAGTSEITYGPNGSPVGGIQPFISRASYSTDPQSKNNGTVIPKDGAGITQGRVVSPGLKNSRWSSPPQEPSAGPATSTVPAHTRSGYTRSAHAGSAKGAKPVELDEQGLLKRPCWDTDKGPVHDDDWQLTEHCERLIIHCGAISGEARGVGDQNASKTLDQVVQICKEILRIKKLQNHEVPLAEAMQVLKKVQREAWVPWIKYWRPGPSVTQVRDAASGNSAPDTQMQDAPALAAQTQYAIETQRSPSQPDSRRSPSQPDSRRSPSQPDSRRFPSQPDSRRFPSQPDSRRSPSQPEPRTPSDAVGHIQAPDLPQGPKFGENQGGFDQISFKQQSRVNTDSANVGIGGVGFGGPAQPFASVSGQQPRPTTGFGGSAQQPQLVTQQAPQQPVTQASSRGFGYVNVQQLPATTQLVTQQASLGGFGHANIQQPSAATQQAQLGQINPFGGTGPTNGQQASTVTQQVQPAQPSNNMVNMPVLYPHGLPKDFDDPQAQLVFEDFFFQNKRLR